MDNQYIDASPEAISVFMLHQNRFMKLQTNWKVMHIHVI